MEKRMHVVRANKEAIMMQQWSNNEATMLQQWSNHEATTKQQRAIMKQQKTTMKQQSTFNPCVFCFTHLPFLQLFVYFSCFGGLAALLLYTNAVPTSDLGRHERTVAPP